MPSLSRSLVPAALSAGLLVAGTGVALAAPPALAPVPAPAAAPSLVVKGEIAARYRSLGGARGFLGQPLTDELVTPNRVGRFNLFQGGSIYWAPGVGAWETHGLIRDKWGSLGYENSRLGFPATNEIRLIGNGAFNRFQGGNIYWSPVTGAHTVFGEILDHWGTFDWERGPLGYPTTDETPTPERFGAFNQFERGNSIYWSPDTGAAQVGGAIRDKWASIGYENGPLGFPYLDELDTTYAGGRISEFEFGTIEWTPERGARVVLGAGEVTTFDPAEDRIRIDELKETYAYRPTDAFAVVTGEDADAEPLTLTDFEARLAVGDVLLVSTSLDTTVQREFIILEGTAAGATAPAALEQRLEASRR